MKSLPCQFASNLTASFLYCFWTFWVRSLTMCSHARRRPLTCKAVEKQKRVPNAIKNSSRLVTGAAASQIIHFLLAGLALAACSKVLLIKSCGGLSHGGWRSRYHCYRESAAQDGPNGQLSSSYSFFSFWLIKHDVPQIKYQTMRQGLLNHTTLF